MWGEQLAVASRFDLMLGWQKVLKLEILLKWIILDNHDDFTVYLGELWSPEMWKTF